VRLRGLCTLDYTVALVPLEAGGDDGASLRVAQMADAAARLRAKAQSLNALAETIVRRREALIKAQVEAARYKGNLFRISSFTVCCLFLFPFAVILLFRPFLPRSAC
jgi:hypothetical protein